MVPLPWERLLWSGRPRRLGARIVGTRFVLTDFRLARLRGAHVDEIALRDIGEVHRIESLLDHLLGTSTLIVDARNARVPSLIVSGIRRGAQVAALIELLAGDPQAAIDPGQHDAIRAALAWEPRLPTEGARGPLAGAVVVLIVICSVVAGLLGHQLPVTYSPLDTIAPNGEKRSRADIVRFMEGAVMPWARETFGPLVGGADRVTCETCHGQNARARDWQMPAVAALPAPVVRDLGWERGGGAIDAQMRNAIYGYLAESDKQTRATYMREVVLPGMARLLQRPAYDFTRPYDENRARHAFGCYHCHRVK